MPILKKEQFEKLARFNSNPCVSIFIPTDRAGKDVLNEKDRINLKSQWKKAVETLKKRGFEQEKIDAIGKPLDDLLTADNNFWRQQSDGLAIFAADGFFEKFTLPVTFEAFVYVSDHFYLKPLIPMFNDDGRFYLLALQLDRVQLYEATRYTIGEVEVSDLTPDRLEDRVGYDYEEKNQQHQTQNSNTGNTTFQGHGAAQRDDRNEILRFFRAVDKGLQKVLNNENVPLVVACQDSYFSIYKDASTYNHLYPESVKGNPSDYENMLSLHSGALQVLDKHFSAERVEKRKQYQELGPKRTSSAVSEIIPAIYEGKVDTLFVQNREDIWGNYNEKMADVDLQDSPDRTNISLMNLAAVKVLEQGGKVYLTEDEFMPEKSSKMNAIFRY